MAHFGKETNKEDIYSPFRLPTDEEVFITRETEKQKRKVRVLVLIDPFRKPKKRLAFLKFGTKRLEYPEHL